MASRAAAGTGDPVNLHRLPEPRSAMENISAVPYRERAVRVGAVTRLVCVVCRGLPAGGGRARQKRSSRRSLTANAVQNIKGRRRGTAERRGYGS